MKDMNFKALMYTRGKGLQFTEDIQTSWCKINLKRMNKTISSEKHFNEETMRLLLEIDNLPELSETMRENFHKQIALFQLKKKPTLEKARRWTITYFGSNSEIYRHINPDVYKNHYHYSYRVWERSVVYAYIIILGDEEMDETQLRALLLPKSCKHIDIRLLPSVMYTKSRNTRLIEKANEKYPSDILPFREYDIPVEYCLAYEEDLLPELRWVGQDLKLDSKFLKYLIS